MLPARLGQLPVRLLAAWRASGSVSPTMPLVAEEGLCPCSNDNSGPLRLIGSSTSTSDLREFFDFASRENREPESSGAFECAATCLRADATEIMLELT